MLLYLTQAAAWITAPPPLDSVHSERLGRAPPPRLAAEEAVRLTGDEAADRMILQRLAATGSAGRAKLRRDELPVAAGRSLADLALGKTVEWKRAVNKARSDAVTAVRVRHIVVDSREMAETLSEQLRGGGARFDELARLSTCAVTRDKGGEVGWSGIEDEHLDEYFPRNLREAAMATKPGDAFLGETPLGWHVVQMNTADAERMEGQLRSLGFARAEEGTPAQVVVLNTCSIREHAEAKVYSYLGPHA
ncbi:hypothetical protein EMIHUDRAFT_245790, partial [Emiliania huxleyi CCMP1516]|uniref:Peptidyl-prolyl cis-trans isomerase n=2 Tax=Emiliania huxleyi TaxID=2903 RepID=A0A0D3IW53_EMIH1